MKIECSICVSHGPYVPQKYLDRYQFEGFSSLVSSGQPCWITRMEYRRTFCEVVTFERCWATLDLSTMKEDRQGWGRRCRSWKKSESWSYTRVGSRIFSRSESKKTYTPNHGGSGQNTSSTSLLWQILLQWLLCQVNPQEGEIVIELPHTWETWDWQCCRYQCSRTESLVPWDQGATTSCPWLT